MPTRTHRFLIMAAAGSLAVVAGLPALADSPRTGPSLLYDAATGRVLFADEADQPWYPASLTKMMTAYLVFKAWKAGTVTPDAKIVISPRANSQPKMRLGLGAGKEITVNDAIEAIIIKSANDISVALAEAVAGSEHAFVAKMNETAFELGMYGTHFINPHGLPGEGQYTTARDLALLTQAIEREFPQHMRYFAMQSADIGKIIIGTHNGVLTHVEGGDGMKTGFTCSAGYNVVASATRRGRRLVAVVLGDKSPMKRTIRAAAMFDYGFRMLGWKELFPGPTIESLPDGKYDREAVRAANLTARYKDCVAPTPPEAVAATGDPAKAGEAKTAAVTTGAVPSADKATEAKPAKGKAKRPVKASKKKKSVKKSAAVEVGVPLALGQ